MRPVGLSSFTAHPTVASSTVVLSSPTSHQLQQQQHHSMNMNNNNGQHQHHHQPYNNHSGSLIGNNTMPLGSPQKAVKRPAMIHVGAYQGGFGLVPPSHSGGNEAQPSNMVSPSALTSPNNYSNGSSIMTSPSNSKTPVGSSTSTNATFVQHNTMSVINTSGPRTPSGKSKKPLMENGITSPKVFRSTALSMIPSTPPKSSQQQQSAQTSPVLTSPGALTSPFKEIPSPLVRSSNTAIEPRRNVQSSANNGMGKITRHLSASSSPSSSSSSSASSNGSSKSSTTPSKKSIMEELKIDKVKNPLHRCISVHAIPSISGIYDNLFNNQSRKLSYSSASAQGKRPSMEDEHFFVKNIEEALGQPPTFRFHAMFGVFDGHCGSECAQHCKETLFQILAKNRCFLQDIVRSFVESFEACDMEFKQKLFGGSDDSLFSAEEYYAGCTANVCVLRNDDLFVANLGDTRCVLAHKGFAIQLSEDHKPNNKDERLRIEKNGGIVSFGRVNGALAVSRAFGDFEFKKKGSNLVSVVPDVSHFILTKDSDFIIIACDGLWDVMSSAEAVKHVYNYLQQFKDPRKACEKLVEKALKDGSMDNITVILILLKELNKT
ncbi:hypothetical protein C9374_012331 [Naegleria lovaniensis]|uniref:PPM-type phosphatase domain-containing protein n=1 Tax=Naegleria lovaniensis TaxID=51637 RepID=A0AA88GE77_NAELO|nr:uncharacterized protein C9374_012331 [Naegleria lovaniensis]KAG2373228.1 hypothetical protein C9374_012331 [Naegleria lovaniensis]